jgi:hypothetical protein
MVRGCFAVLVGLALLAVTGCAPRAVPAFSISPHAVQRQSKTELLERAQQVYSAYLREVQSVSEKRNRGVTALRPLLSPDAYDAEVASFETLDARGIHTVGETELVAFKAQSVDVERQRVSAYACVDLSEVHVLNESGRDVTPGARPDRQTSLPSFAMHEGRMVIEENGTWSGASIC